MLPRPLHLSARAALTLLLACSGGEVVDGGGNEMTPAPWPEGPPQSTGCLEKPAPPTPTRLLTREEYDNTVRDLLGDATRPARAFPLEPRVLGFENNAGAHQVNPLLVAAYLDAAEALAARAVTTQRDTLLGGCGIEVFGERGCMMHFFNRVLPRAFRRPPTEEEQTALATFFEATAQKLGFDTALEWTLQVILQSPQFLYRFERGVPAGSGYRALSQHELASRLSYFLWSSMPDDALLAAAERGELNTPAALAAHARRMLEDPKARDTVHNFFRQYLALDGMAKIEKSTAVYPEFSAEIAPAWRTGLDLFIDDFWEKDATLHTLFTSPRIYVNVATAPLYGMSMSGQGFMGADMTPSTRAGLLTQPGLMAELAGPLSSSPVRRGVFIREKVLCEPLTPPPPDVSIEPPDPSPTATTRERFAEHEANPACGGCHVKIDPIGFGFEQYDALGRFRTTENGKPIDATGLIYGAQEPALSGTFDGAAQLGAKLAASNQAHDCVATQWFRYAMGRVEGHGDGCGLEEVRARFFESGGDFKELLVAITQTPAFRSRSVSIEEAAP